MKWAEDEQRLNWHREVTIEYDKCKQDPNYVCSASFITKAAEYGPAEIALHTPYRAGLCR